MRNLGILVVVFWLLPFGAISSQEKGDDFLTADGKLKQQLVVRDLQSGFAGVTGRQWNVEPSGEWTLGQVFQGKVKVEKKGKLGGNELKALAGELAKFKLTSLESKKGRIPTNPKSIEIKWGKKNSVLIAMPGATLKVDPATLEGRYWGIVKSVEKATVGK